MTSLPYTVVIGLEVHVQLRTDSKLFCRCSTRFSPDAPNSQTCPVCLGLPGSLPVMNRRAFELAVRAALALDCTIAAFTKWDRKQYYYPDLPKAYQISQYDLPFSSSGHVTLPALTAEDESRRIRITRVHLEEDAGKTLHDETGRGGQSMVDLNRTGTPLLEIVSEPDLRSPAEARLYLERLRTLLLFLEVSDCNMQEGSLRCDANINLHIPDGDLMVATPIVELKNMNSFRNVELAVEYETRRQWQQWQKAHVRMGDIPKQTRGWDPDRGATFVQREKEESSDYRYFPDPDLVPVVLTPAEIEAFRSTLPETPVRKLQRFVTDFGLSEYDAGVIMEQGPELTGYFERVATVCGDGKTAANWVTQDVLRDLNADGLTIREFQLSAELLGQLLQQVTSARITTRSAREVYGELRQRAATGQSLEAADVETMIVQRGLEIVRDTGALLAAISAVIASRPDAVADVRGGKQQAAGPLIGMVMKQVSGADARQVRELLMQCISALPD